MYFTGFADEAASDIDGQIKATKSLGWENIEARNINGTNIHNLTEEDFDIVVAKLEKANVKVNCFGSEIANWAQSIEEPFEQTLEVTRRAITRMNRLGTKLIRIMSYAILRDRDPDDQIKAERFKRLRVITQMFADQGITAVHENCMNFGGMSYHNTLELVENVPGLKLVFDTANPVFTFDYSKPKPYPKQSSWEFYNNVKQHIAHIHIKDAIYKAEKPGSIFPDCEFTFPGKGNAQIPKILTDLIGNGYDGGISIEPHLSTVFHEQAVTSSEKLNFENYIEFGRQTEKLINKIKQTC